MKQLIGLAAVVVLVSPIGLAAQEPSADAQIAQAVLPLPESLRASATVVTYDAQGNRRVLRQGTGVMVCQPDGPAPGFAVSCYHKSLAPTRDLQAKLRAEGKDAKQVSAAVEAARKAGTLKPPEYGTMSYSLSGKDEASARRLWVMFVPNATAESTGLPTARGQGTPWLMRAGTPAAHVMMPQPSQPPTTNP